MQNDTYYCYVVWSSTGHKYYIGVTDDPSRRVADHNAGISKWTKRYAGSWQLIWQKNFSTLSDARKFESLLKRQKGGSGFYKLTGLPKPAGS